MAFLDETGLAEVWSLADAKFSEVAIGSYTGAGSYGASNPNSLTFNFAPKFVWVFASTYGTEPYFANYYNPSNTSQTAVIPYMACDNLTTSYVNRLGFCLNGRPENCYAKKSADGKTIYWYNISTATEQMNQSNYKFCYIAIG